MTDAQHLFDLAQKHFHDIASDVEKHFDQVSSHLRDWLPLDPATIFSAPPRPTPPPPPPTTYQILQSWSLRHRRALLAAGTAFLLTGSIASVLYTHHLHTSRHHRRRRANKAPSGARTDVVVVAPAAVASPLASSLYLDLERRGFVVYVVAHTAEDAAYISSHSRMDLRPLRVDLLDPFTAREQMGQFEGMFGRQYRVLEDAAPHRLRFVGLVLVPETEEVVARRVEDVSSEEWADALNAKVLNTIATTQLFLSSLQHHAGKLLLLTPSVTPSLKPPGHAVESTVYAALEAFVTSLSAETAPIVSAQQGKAEGPTGSVGGDGGVAITHFKLGNLDIPSLTSRQQRRGDLDPSTAATRARKRVKATPVRKLHQAVFDCLTAKHPPAATIHVGRGSLAYSLIGSWMPRGAVGWLMGGRRENGGIAAVGNGEERRGEDGPEAEDEDGEKESREDLRGSMGSLTWERI